MESRTPRTLQATHRMVEVWCMVIVTAGLLVGFLAGPASALTNVGGWELQMIRQGEFVVDPQVDDGRVAWGRRAFASMGVTPAVLVYDETEGQTAAYPTEADVTQLSLHADHLAYVTRDQVGLAEVHLRTLSTGTDVTVTGPMVRWAECVVRGPWVVWVEGHSATNRLMAYDIATSRASILADQQTVDSPVYDFWASERWVVFTTYDRVEQRFVAWTAERMTGGLRRLPFAERPEHLDGDHVYYVAKGDGGSPTLHRFDLASDTDSAVATNAEIQGVRADGQHIAWASWEKGQAFLVWLDLEDGTPIRIPAPGYLVGGLRLQGDLLIWVGQSRVPRYPDGYSYGQSYLFVYDGSRGAVTRLAVVAGYEQTWNTDGESVVTPVIRRGGGLALASRSPSPPPGFADVPGTDPYYTAAAGLQELGALVGYPAAQGTDARPNAPLTRAQFAKMLAVALDVPLSEGLVAPFVDLGADDPATLFPHEYVAALAKLGVIKGTSADHFSPYAQLTRAQLVTLIVRAVKALHPELLPPSPYSPYNKYPTLGSFDPVHAANMWLAEQQGLLDGIVGFTPDWSPWQAATRAEAAQVLWNVVARLEPSS